MDRNLLNKYFRDQCTEEELEEVLDWLQTDEGQQYLEQDIHQLDEELMKESKLSPYPEVDTERIFNRIQLSKKKDHKKNSRWGVGVRAASILLLVTALSALLYWGGITGMSDESPEPDYATYVTKPNQQKVFTLSDGTQIRLNEQSQLTVPVKLEGGKRNVNLEGEAYFEVARDTEHPFIVNTKGSTIEVLGTKFNVKTDSIQNCIEVAVIEGKVALKQKGDGSSGGALLTRNNFGLLHLGDGQITIEKVNAKNYLSWIYNRLVYSGETLEQVSRQIEHLYNVEVVFKSRKLRKLKLTANIERTGLSEVLDVIAKTFNITYQKRENGKIVWMT